MTKAIRPYGRDKIAAHLPTGTRHLKLLRQAALFEAVYSQHGKVTAFDLVYPLCCRHRMAAIVGRLQHPNLAPVCSWCGNRHAAFEYCYDKTVDGAGAG